MIQFDYEYICNFQEQKNPKHKGLFFKMIKKA